MALFVASGIRRIEGLAAIFISIKIVVMLRKCHVAGKHELWFLTIALFSLLLVKSDGLI